MSTTTRDTRQSIISAAAELFRKQGYAATTVQQVAELSGISKGNLTYHFPNKQAMCMEVLDQALSYVRDGLLRRCFESSTDAVGALDEFAVRMRRWYLDGDGQFVGCLFTNLALETQHTDVAIAQRACACLIDVRDQLGVHLAEAQTLGRVRSDMPAECLTRKFFWMWEGALAMSRAMNDPQEFDEFRASMPTWLAP